MASRTAYLRRARHWLANRGWRGLLGELWYRGRLRLAGKPVPGRENGNEAPHPFDLRYGVDTSGLLWGESLQSVQAGDAAFWATGYYGISPSTFEAALRSLGLNWKQFSFVDIGCGKGRALLLALRFPFQQVLGVELSAPLVAAANRNLELFQPDWRLASTPARAMLGDATTFAVPGGPLLVFLYHPFAAPVMKRFLDHMVNALRAEPREIVLLYANPELASLVDALPGVERLWQQTFELTEEEGQADRFGSHGEIFAAFRLQHA